MASELQPVSLNVSVKGTSCSVAALRRQGSGAPLVCLHGFGSTKEDYADLALFPATRERPLFLMDAPGFGSSKISDPSALDIGFLVEVALACCNAVGIDSFHLSGHSMGGLTALMLAANHRDRVLSFSNIEGNVSPEDCFLSRQIVQHPTDSDEAFFAAFIERVRNIPQASSHLYALTLPMKVQVSSVRPVFESMVALSDEAPLMELFTGLPFPRQFIHGSENATLSYLPHLPTRGVGVVEIPHSAHFPMYANPPALWSAMAGLIEKAER